MEMNFDEFKKLINLVKTNTVVEESDYSLEMAKIWFLIGAGKRTAAIKTLRDFKSLDLKTAKGQIDAMMEASDSFD